MPGSWSLWRTVNSFLGLLTRPWAHEAKAEARKSEAEVEAEATESEAEAEASHHEAEAKAKATN